MEPLIFAIELAVTTIAAEHSNLKDADLAAVYRTYADYYHRLIDGEEAFPPTAKKALIDDLYAAIGDELADREELQLEDILLDDNRYPSLPHLYADAFEQLAAAVPAVAGRGKRRYLDEVAEKEVLILDRRWLRDTYGIKISPYPVYGKTNITQAEVNRQLTQEPDLNKILRNFESRRKNAADDVSVYVILTTLYVLVGQEEKAYAMAREGREKFPDSAHLAAVYVLFQESTEATAAVAHTLRPIQEFTPGKLGFYSDTEYVLLERAYGHAAIALENERDTYRHLENLLRLGVPDRDD